MALDAFANRYFPALEPAMHTNYQYRIEITSPRPYFAEVPYYLWGEVNYDSEGDCKRPTDRLWSWFQLTNRETREAVDIAGKERVFTLSSPDQQLAARAALFLCERAGGRVIGEDPRKAVGNWDHATAMRRALPVREEFERPELSPFDSDLFWGAWKWVGLFATDFTWVGRWIMHSVVRGDKRAVNLCAEWLRHGTVDKRQSAALRYAVEKLTGEKFPTDQALVHWYFSEGGKDQYPEPDFEAWYREGIRKGEIGG